MHFHADLIKAKTEDLHFHADLKRVSGVLIMHTRVNPTNKRRIGLGALVVVLALPQMTLTCSRSKIPTMNMYSPYTPEIQIFISFALR